MPDKERETAVNSPFGPRDVSRLVMLLGEAAPPRTAFAKALKHYYPSAPPVEVIIVAGWLVPADGDRLREPVLTNDELAARCYSMEDPFEGITMLPLPQAGPRFSYFDGPIKNITPRPAPITLANLHRIITDPPPRLKALSALVRTEYETHGKSRRYSEQKKRLDYFSVGGIFATRADDKVLLKSGLLVVDLDEMKGGAAQAKDQLLTDVALSPALGLLFVSPSGDGLKGVLAADPRIDRATNYQRIARHLRRRYAWGYTLDERTADLSRACFVCHDPDAYLNPAFAAKPI